MHPLTPHTDVPDYLKEYKQNSGGIWEHHPRIDYTAFFRESEYSDYVKITGVKTGYPGRQHHHGEPSYTVSSAPPDRSISQPVFPSPVPQLVSDSQPVNEDQGNLTTGNIVSTDHVESIQNVEDCPPDKGNVTTPPPDPSADHSPPLPPAPLVADPNKSDVNIETPQDEGKVDISCNSDEALSDSSGKFLYRSSNYPILSYISTSVKCQFPMTLKTRILVVWNFTKDLNQNTWRHAIHETSNDRIHMPVFWPVIPIILIRTPNPNVKLNHIQALNLQARDSDHKGLLKKIVYREIHLTW